MWTASLQEEMSNHFFWGTWEQKFYFFCYVCIKELKIFNDSVKAKVKQCWCKWFSLAVHRWHSTFSYQGMVHLSVENELTTPYHIIKQHDPVKIFHRHKNYDAHWEKQVTVINLNISNQNCLRNLSEPNLTGYVIQRFFFFFISPQKLGYSLEAPNWGTSNGYPQHMLLWRNEKNINTFWLNKSTFYRAISLFTHACGSK